MLSSLDLFRVSILCKMYLIFTALQNCLSLGSLVFVTIVVIKHNSIYLQLYYFITNVYSI